MNLKFMDFIFIDVVLRTDNKRSSNKLGITQSYSGIKQREIEYFFCKYILQKEKLKIEYIRKGLSNVDVFTKPVEKQCLIKNHENQCTRQEGKSKEISKKI
eukprot:snap_masked-scaffold_26-processed-gene-4.37-mRNA-1 protein AED:1.00 eAED:1.00 QI:0/-1/0/0/-1/1/1/0/100